MHMCVREHVYFYACVCVCMSVLSSCINAIHVYAVCIRYLDVYGH